MERKDRKSSCLYSVNTYAMRQLLPFYKADHSGNSHQGRDCVRQSSGNKCEASKHQFIEMIVYFTGSFLKACFKSNHRKIISTFKKITRNNEEGKKPT